jgi:hypothetical protein
VKIELQRNDVIIIWLKVIIFKGLPISDKPICLIIDISLDGSHRFPPRAPALLSAFGNLLFRFRLQRQITSQRANEQIMLQLLTSKS